MIDFKRFELDNGLRIILHRDTSTPLVAVNVLYNVGARDEDPDRTGFAHLFEHLMFEGSENIPDFDNALQMAGGENNAFTNNDFTNYYLTIPAQNLETALWLESDRMKKLAFSEEKLEIQKNVVIEEFKQSYLNQPYGDIWLLLRPLIYKVHPYQWPTIGKNIDHVRYASLTDVAGFFYKFYHPGNAVLVLSGNINFNEAESLVKKWFSDIQPGEISPRLYPEEPSQDKQRLLQVERDVPFNDLYLAFHTGSRIDKGFYITDLITDILAGGQSGRLREKLVRDRRIFSYANAWISSSIDKGFLAITGKLMNGQSVAGAREAIWEELEGLKREIIAPRELQKVKNKLEAANTFAEVGILSKAMNLAFYELLGDARLINHQNENYFSVTSDSILQTSDELFQEQKSSELHYLAITQK